MIIIQIKAKRSGDLQPSLSDFAFTRRGSHCGARWFVKRYNQLPFF